MNKHIISLKRNAQTLTFQTQRANTKSSNAMRNTTKRDITMKAKLIEGIFIMTQYEICTDNKKVGCLETTIGKVSDRVRVYLSDLIEFVRV